MDSREQLVTVTYDESDYQQGERRMVYTLVGTPEQIADHVREGVLNSLSYYSQVNGMHLSFVSPANVMRLEGS